MQTILDTVVPFFALIFCGYGAGRLGVLPAPAAAGLNTFVFYFALPAFVFSLLSTAPLSEVANGPFMGAYLSAGLVVLAAAYTMGRSLFGLNSDEAAVLGLAAVLPNAGYMGLPLVSAVFGREAALPIVVALTIEAAVFIPLGIAAIEASKGTADGPLRILASTASALARNPLILAIVAGLLASALNLQPPTPVNNFVSLLADTAGPCALFALGATLAGRHTSGGPQVLSMISLKLFVHPACVWLTTALLFPVEPLWATAALLGAALPVAANVFVVARQYDTYVQPASSAILISTATSLLTVSILLTLLQPA